MELFAPSALRGRFALRALFAAAFALLVNGLSVCVPSSADVPVQTCNAIWGKQAALVSATG